MSPWSRALSLAFCADPVKTGTGFKELFQSSGFSAENIRLLGVRVQFSLLCWLC